MCGPPHSGTHFLSIFRWPGPCLSAGSRGLAHLSWAHLKTAAFLGIPCAVPEPPLYAVPRVWALASDHLLSNGRLAGKCGLGAVAGLVQSSISAQLHGQWVTCQWLEMGRGGSMCASQQLKNALACCLWAGLPRLCWPLPVTMVCDEFWRAIGGYNDRSISRMRKRRLRRANQLLWAPEQLELSWEGLLILCCPAIWPPKPRTFPCKFIRKSIFNVHTCLPSLELF